MKESADNLKHLTKCPICSKKYNNSKILLLEEDESGTTFHLTCDKCFTSVLVFILNDQNGFVSVGVATDMNRAEVKKFFKKESITPNEIIRVHEHLKGAKGGIEEII